MHRILFFMLCGFALLNTDASAGNRFDKVQHADETITPISISSRITDNSDLQQVVKQGEGRFDNSLGLNVHPEEMPRLRQLIGARIGRPLDFFKGWNPQGEAHVTVITPLEYIDILRGPDPARPLLTMQRIGEIAENMQMQQARLELVSIGSGKKLIEGRLEETFFLIVASEKLLQIRRAIHAEFVKNGGKAEAWNPDRFFPHITIGFTLRDLHEADGIIKDVANSCDSRLRIQLDSAAD